MHTRDGGLALIDCCRCTEKVWCTIHCDSQQLITFIIPRWLRKVSFDVSSFIVHIHPVIDPCSASTIEHLKQTLEDGEVVVFFYCDFRSKRTTSAAEVMRSLLSQLLCHMGDHGVDPGDLPNKILEQKSDGTLSLNDLDKLCDLLSSAASCFSYQPIVVIDALDECADVEALLRALVALNLGDVRLLVTSRPDQTILDRFPKHLSLSFGNVAKAVAADIEVYVRQEVEMQGWLRSAGPEMKDEIRVKLTERAEGRYGFVL